MYNTSNPAELYAGTTWELLPDNKFIKTGSTPLQHAGSNSIKITKANLPAEKLQVESHSMTRGTMDITGKVVFPSKELHSYTCTGAFTRVATNLLLDNTGWNGYQSGAFDFKASRSWSGNTSNASPYTTQMGSGTPISINPEHITVKAWKRLS